MELLVTCSVEGRLSLFEPTLSEPATDPVDDWAEGMAQRAIQAGWSADPDGHVLCPAHRQSCQSNIDACGLEASKVTHPSLVAPKPSIAEDRNWPASVFDRSSVSSATKPSDARRGPGRHEWDHSAGHPRRSPCKVWSAETRAEHPSPQSLFDPGMLSCPNPSRSRASFRKVREKRSLAQNLYATDAQNAGLKSRLSDCGRPPDVRDAMAPSADQAPCA
jgi:hypothetical protein